MRTAADDPAGVVVFHADVGVVGAGFGGGDQDQHRVQAGGQVGSFDQLAADAVALPGLVDGQVGEIGAVVKVRDRTRDADEHSVDAGGEDDVGVFEHARDRF